MPEYPAGQATLEPADSDLAAIAALSTTVFGRNLLTLADAAAGRTALGLGTAAVAASTAFDAAGAAAAAQAASQPADADLAAIAALNTTVFGRSFLDRADAAAGRALLGLGTAATTDQTAYVLSKASNAISGTDPFSVGITATAVSDDLKYGVYITDDAASNGRLLHIDHYGAGSTGGSYQARGIDVFNRPGAHTAMAIHQYSRAHEAVYFDNTDTGVILLLRNTENQSANPRNIGTGHLIEFDGYTLTTFTDGSITSGSKTFTSVALGLQTSDTNRIVAATGIVAEIIGTGQAATRIASVPVTTIAAGSNGASLPQGTINVSSTTGFEASGTVLVTTASGQQQVAYTGITATSFTGCTGGTGAMSTGADVRQAVLSAAATATTSGTLSFTITRTVGILGDLHRAITFVARDTNFPWTFTASVPVTALWVEQRQAATGLQIVQSGAGAALSISMNSGAAGQYPLFISGKDYGPEIVTTTNGGRSLRVNKTGTGTGVALTVINKGTDPSIDVQDATSSRFQVLPSGQVKYANSALEATASGSAALGANSPAVTLTAPYTWWKVTTSDGSQGYIPVWK